MFGIDARVGAVPGEYCPDVHSVNARGVAKLVGTAQRVLPKAWLFSTLVTGGDDIRLQHVLEEVYGYLGLAFDRASVGSIRAESPHAELGEVELALLEVFGIETVAVSQVDSVTLGVAASLLPHHCCP
ncbi:hypothetical protein ACJ5H2_22350 (plasmid) [Nocardioides sp. R1-1]|uniref:hypothetical protein n=1 Tax=Nocardioides sp. R1-1 TaxID=3383502 RepID=UPI0038D2171A